MKAKMLFTGANGFVGRNLLPLVSQTYQVFTLGTKNSYFNKDITKSITHFPIKFDVVFHVAGKAHTIPKTKEEEKEFYDVNFEGTKNICSALELNTPKVFIYVSSVAVYGRDEGKEIDETHPLKGESPYAKSKILAESYLMNWCREYKVRLFIIRPSLIVGVNPLGNLKDMINAIKKGYYFNVGGGKAKKSVVWVEDFSGLIDRCMEKQVGGIYNFCNDENPDFLTLSNKISNLLGKSRPKNIPLVIGKVLAFFGDFLGTKAPINSKKLDKITKSLTFSNKKMKEEIGVGLTSVTNKFSL